MTKNWGHPLQNFEIILEIQWDHRRCLCPLLLIRSLLSSNHVAAKSHIEPFHAKQGDMLTGNYWPRLCRHSLQSSSDDWQQITYAHLRERRVCVSFNISKMISLSQHNGAQANESHKVIELYSNTTGPFSPNCPGQPIAYMS